MKVVYIFVYAFISTFCEIKAYDCPESWVTSDKACYYFSDTYLRWHEAEDLCVVSGGHLVSIHSEEELTWIDEHVNQTRYWTGLNDMLSEGDYVWTDGSETDYLIWGEQQPGGSNAENCVVFYTTEAPKSENRKTFYETTCGLTYPYICKKLKDGLDTYCPDFFVLWENDCYFFSTDVLPWEDARNVCLELGGDLASIHSEEENHFISMENHFPEYVSIWHGLNDISKEGVYEWSDGSPVDYLNWYDTEPTGNEDQNCCYAGSKGYLYDCAWGDNYCSNNYYYVCKKPLDVSSKTGRE